MSAEKWDIGQETLDFIEKNADADVRSLALRGRSFPGVDLSFALQQIAGRQMARRKLPTFAATAGLIYPPHLSMEQCSGEPLARYKGQLARRLLGAERAETREETCRFVDFTGGFGVDFTFFTLALRPSFAHLKATYVEENPQLCAISSRNFPLLGVEADVVCGNAADYLHGLVAADLAFLDPARRHADGSRAFAIADCRPNVLELSNELTQKVRWTIVKLSPMLDWHEAVRLLPQTCEVHILATGNECKELLLVLSAQNELPPLTVHCVNDGMTFSYEASESPAATLAPGGEPKFLYVPNAATMKAGCFAQLSARFGLSPVCANSHLFVSPRAVEDFPGRCFQISAISSMNKRELRSVLAHVDRANVAVRNFPLSAEELRRRLRLKDGGNTYIFGTTLSDGSHRLFVCRPVGGG